MLKFYRWRRTARHAHLTTCQ